MGNYVGYKLCTRTVILSRVGHFGAFKKLFPGFNFCALVLFINYSLSTHISALHDELLTILMSIEWVQQLSRYNDACILGSPLALLLVL